MAKYRDWEGWGQISRTKAVISAAAIIAIIVGGYLLYTYPGVIARMSGRVDGAGAESVHFIVGFFRSSMKVIVTLNGSGVFIVNVYNSAGQVEWNASLTTVSSGATTTESAWLPASGNYTLTISYWGSMDYDIKVLAKGAPW